MFMNRFLLCSFTLAYVFQATKGFCGGRDPVVDICTKSEAIMEISVFIDTVKGLQLPCTCSISPALSTVNVLLSFLSFSPPNFNMEYRLNDIVLNRTKVKASTTLSETTEIVLVSSIKAEESCVLLSTADGSKFNISCEETMSSTTSFPVTKVTESTFAHSTYEQSTLSTTVSVEDNTNIRSVNENGVDIGVIGPAIGGAVGFIGLIIVIVIVICCKRKSSSKKHTTQVKTSQNDTQEHTKNDEDDDDDYYMTENPMYNLTDTPQYTPVTNTEDDFIETNEGNNRHLSDHYETLPDSPNDVNVPLTQTGEDQGDSFTATPEVVQDTGNDYHIIGEVKDDKSYPSYQHI